MSSRRDVVSGLLAAAAIAMGAGCRAGRSSGSRRRAPLLRIATTDGNPHESDPAWRGLALALRALPKDRRSELVRQVSAWLEEMEAKANPLIEDLEGRSPTLDGVRSWFLPAYNSACALVRDRFRVPGRDWWVTPVRADSLAETVQAWPAWPESGAPGDDPDGEAARFAAWPVSRALLVDAVSHEGAVDAARAVAPRSCERSSCIGTFVLHASARAEPSPEFAELGALARRARKLLTRAKRTTDDPWAAALLADIPSVEPVPALERWLDLAPSEMLIVPRLSAAARHEEFVREVRALVSRSVRLARIVNSFR